MSNMNLLFDLATSISEGRKDHHASGDKVFKINGKDVKLSMPEQERALTRSIQAFMHTPTVGKKESRIQAFSGSSDLPQLTADVFNNTMATPNFDLAWQEAFRGVQLSKGQLFWEIATTSTGMVFKEIPEGGKIEYEGVAGSKAIVNIKKYGAALGITWEVIEGRKLYQFVQLLEDARAKMYQLWADVHYGLLDSGATGHDVSWQLAVTDKILDRDIATINAGAFAIANACKDKGYGDTANAQFMLYGSPALRPRINAALRATNSELATGSSQGVTVDFNVTPKYTFNSAIASNHALLVLPGQRIQNAVYLRELGLSRQEIESLTELRTYWTAFGAAVGDTDQVYDLAFA